MKVSFTAKIKNMLRQEDKARVELQFNAKGTVDTAPMNTKEAELITSLLIKPIVADELKIGSNIKITFETDDA